MASEAEILAHIGRQPNRQAGFKQLVRELGAHGEGRHDLRDTLGRLVREGTLVESRGQMFSLAKGGGFFSGRLVRHRDGYGFVIPDQPPPGAAGDIYIQEYAMADAMHGDRVLVRLGKVDESGRAEGRIHKVLKRTHETIVGHFRATPRGSFVRPWDERVQAEIVIPPSEPLPAGARHADLDGMIVNVELTQFPSLTDRAQGRVLEVLGRPGDFGIDVEIIIRKHHLPHRFPAEVAEEAAAVPQLLSAADKEGRRDFRSLPIVTIDGETARDFDDAVYVERLDNRPEGGGAYLLHVHIADVAHYVRAGAPLDREARLRGTSVYFPDRAVPMLPHELSSSICSLQPQVERLVLSCLMTIDRQGQVIGYELAEGVIRSAERMTYTNVNLVLENDPGMRQRYAALAPGFELMRELALVLNARRGRRGSIDFDLPEPEIEFDEFGEMSSITRSERNIAHRLIEEFMLAANETVAGHLDRLGLASLYRIHQKPDPKRVMEFEEIAAGFGYSLGVGGLPVARLRLRSGQGAGRRTRFGSVRGDRSDRTLEIPTDIAVTPRHYQQLTKAIAGKPEERILSYLMLRSLKQARYSEQNSGHFALASPEYTHFTSPIRRYPDLIVHRILKQVLHGWVARETTASGTTASETTAPGTAGPAEPATPVRRRKQKPAQGEPRPPRPGPISEAELKLVGEETSESERRAQEAERQLLEWKKVTFMAQRVGEEFDGLVVNVTRFGFFVELADVFVEGLVHSSSLTDDRYFFREHTREWVGERTRRRFGLGARVRVLVERVDPVALKINFALANPAAAQPAAR